MKKSSKINNFPDELRFKFFEDNYWECWGCGMNHANCAHHIFGRGHGEGCEKSIFNFAPMGNHECHLPRHGYWMTTEGRRELFMKTLAFMEKIDYTLKDIDQQFLEKYGEEIYKLGLKI